MWRDGKFAEYQPSRTDIRIAEAEMFEQWRPPVIEVPVPVLVVKR